VIISIDKMNLLMNYFIELITYLIVKMI
jgi:hypothetical protein